jgi:hypothetical protein
MSARLLPRDLHLPRFSPLKPSTTQVFQLFQFVFELLPGIGLAPIPFPKSALLLRASLTKQSYQHSPSPTRAGEHNLLTIARSNLAATCAAALSNLRFIYRTSFSDCDCLRSRNLWSFVSD